MITELGVEVKSTGTMSDLFSDEDTIEADEIGRILL